MEEFPRQYRLNISIGLLGEPAAGSSGRRILRGGSPISKGATERAGARRPDLEAIFQSAP
jgi:hypothetical protein